MSQKINLDMPVSTVEYCQEFEFFDLVVEKLVDSACCEMVISPSFCFFASKLQFLPNQQTLTDLDFLPNN